MTLLTGHLLVPTSQNTDTGLWFIFHHESDGILAFDLTQKHPEIPYRLWDMDALEEELKNWQWTLIPATPDLVFYTPRQNRLEKARRSIN